MKWKRLPQVMLIGANVGMGVALLWHFSMMLILGEFAIQELSPIIFWSEVALVVGITIGNLIAFKMFLRRGNDKNILRH